MASGDPDWSLQGSATLGTSRSSKGLPKTTVKDTQEAALVRPEMAAIAFPPIPLAGSDHVTQREGGWEM
jgi:hypothetical protein